VLTPRAVQCPQTITVLAAPTAAAEPPFVETAVRFRVAAAGRSAPRHDEMIVTVMIAPGFHFDADPASFSYLVPIAPNLDVVTPAGVVYPAPMRSRPAFARAGIKVFEDEVSIIAEPPAGALRSHRSISGSVGVQACNDQTSTAPETPPQRVPACLSRVRARQAKP
jgi:hypothetical protein